MKKVVASIYAQTVANLARLHDIAKNAESKQALTEAKLAVECACIAEKGNYEQTQTDTTERETSRD